MRLADDHSHCARESEIGKSVANGLGQGPKEEVFGDAGVPLWRRLGTAVELAEEPVESGDKGGDHVVSFFTEKILLVRNVAY